MKPAWLISASVAGALHAWILFVFHPGTPAQALALGDDSSAVELSVVEAAPGEPAPAAAPEAVPAPAEPEPPKAPPERVPPPPEPPPAPEPEPLPPPLVEPAVKERPRPAATPQPRATPKPSATAQPRVARAISSGTGVNSASGNPGAGGGRGGGATTKARYRSNPRPEYPAAARRFGQQGTVMLAVEVTADGRAGSVRLAQSSGFPLLDAAALQAVRRWTFEPARNLGVAVASHVEVPVRFDLRQR